ncbi:zinc ABC transporter substrate-binding protein [Aquifex pyrophilus]
MMALFFLLTFIVFSFAQIKVVATYPWIGSLVREIGKDNVSVYVIAKPNEDPHFVVPKPSHIVHLRRADLLVINGASLEIGFLPPLLDQSANPRIQPGSPGFLDLSQFVELIQKPRQVSRALGDIHPEGNPHYHLDPMNIPKLAKAITMKLCELDTDNCNAYRKNLEEFLSRWEIKLKEWNEKMKPLRGKKVIAYHHLYDYFLLRYGLILVGTIEPLPGIPPNPRHINKLLEKMKKENVKCILQDTYHEKKTARFLASRTGAVVLVLPHDGYDIFKLFETITGEFQKCR